MDLLLEYDESLKWKRAFFLPPTSRGTSGNALLLTNRGFGGGIGDVSLVVSLLTGSLLSCQYPIHPPAQDPSRHPFFVVNTAKPFNAEPPPELLLDAGFITPNELYYVRNHLPVPEVDAQTYRLKVEIGGKAARCLSYSLEDLKTKFPHVGGRGGRGSGFALGV